MLVPKIYLAGPLIFRTDARREGERLKDICHGYGMIGLFPLDLEFALPKDGTAAARAICASCHDMIRQADAVVADLSPFRGPHCDDGTAFEIGIARERGIPIFGYAADLSPLSHRIVHTIPKDGAFRDADGYEVENFNQPFNAMIAGALTSPPFQTAAEALAACALFMLGAASKDLSAGFEPDIC